MAEGEATESEMRCRQIERIYTELKPERRRVPIGNIETVKASRRKQENKHQHRQSHVIKRRKGNDLKGNRVERVCRDTLSLRRTLNLHSMLIVEWCCKGVENTGLAHRRVARQDLRHRRD